MLIHEYLIETARRLPEKIALVSGNTRLKYSTIDEKSNRLARALIQIGCQKQDRIIVFIGNSPETVISVYGVMKAGGVFILINPTQKSQKLNYIINDTDAETVICDVRKASILREAIVGTKVKNVIWCTSSTDSKKISEINNLGLQIQLYNWMDLTGVDSVSSSTKLPRVIDVDLATLFYTSGTTGEPKGIMNAHYNAVAVMKSLTTIFKNDENDIIMNALPLSFDYGLYQVFMTFMFGGTVILEKSFLYPYIIAKLIEKEKASGFPFVPMMAALFFKLEDIKKFDFSRVRYITTSTAALPPHYIPKLKALFPNAKLFSRYGLSESVTATYLPPEKLEEKPDSVGIPIPNTEAFIVDETEHKVACGQVGELVIRGSIVMQGYWKSPKLTEKVFRRGRYPGDTLLYTGDLFRQDEDGDLYFIGRKDDLIKTGGERVSPKEVENILVDIEGVIEAAIISVPDSILGSALKAFVVPKRQIQIDVDNIKRYCLRNLESFMVPKYIEIRRDLPKTENGKIDKKLLY